MKIPKKIKNNEVRPASGGVRYIEKNYNKFNSEYINQKNSNFNNNNDELNEMRESYALAENERNSIKKNNKIKDNNIHYYDNKGGYLQNNKNSYGFNGMSTYNYNSFRKNNKFN